MLKVKRVVTVDVKQPKRLVSATREVKSLDRAISNANRAVSSHIQTSAIERQNIIREMLARWRWELLSIEQEGMTVLVTAKNIDSGNEYVREV